MERHRGAFIPHLRREGYTLKKKRKIISLLVISVVLIFVFAFSSMAADASHYEKPDITELKEDSNILTMSVLIDFDGTNGIAVGRLTKKPIIVAADGYLTVFKKVGDDLEYVAEGITHVTTGSLGVTVYFEAEHGVEYLAIFEGEVRKEGEEFTYGEMFGINTTKVCP